MGWNINMTSNKTIEEKTIDEIVELLPEKYSTEQHIQKHIPNFKHKQSWGWSVVCDIHTPQKNIVTIGGSTGISGHIAHEFANYLKQELEKRGHNIKIGEYRY